MQGRKTTHFIIFCQPDSLANKEIDFVIKSLENSYSGIVKKLRLKDNFSKIKYYLYPDNKTKFKAMGDDGNANAVIKDFAIYGIYNQKTKIIGKHEIVHLLVHDWGRPPELFRQGLAEATEDKWHNVNHHQWVKKFYKDKKFIALNELLDDEKFWQFNDLITYPESGSFVKYAIENYGLELFKKLYHELDDNFSDQQNEEQIKKMIGISLKELETKWLDYVNKKY